MHEILIADDHPLFRESLGRAVRRAVGDAKLHEAGDVAAPVRELEQHPRSDLLLLDLNRPGAHGYSAPVHTRSADPSIPIVMVSDNDDGRTVNRALALGAADCIPSRVDEALLPMHGAQRLARLGPAPSAVRTVGPWEAWTRDPAA